MVYYQDLTYYSFQHFENAINVGWINKRADYSKGIVTEEFLDKLWKYTKYPLNTVRGMNDTIDMFYNKEKVTLGFSEIRVLSKDGKKKFAAPDLILHYVMKYNYCPPKEFIDAVLFGPSPDSLEYKNYMSKYDELNLWGENTEFVELSKKLRETIISNKNEFIKNFISEYLEYLNIITEEGSLLNVSILNKNADLAKFFIQTNIDINKFSGVELISALLNSENEIVELLLQKDILFNLSSPKTNPLFIAVRKGNSDAVRMILDRGIDTTLEYSNEFMKSFSVIQLAQKMNQNEIVAILKAYESKE